MIKDTFTIYDELNERRSRTSRYYVVMFHRDGSKSPRWITWDDQYVSKPRGHYTFRSIKTAWSFVKEIPRICLLFTLDVYIVHGGRAMKVLTFPDGDPAATLILPKVWIKPEKQVN